MGRGKRSKGRNKKRNGSRVRNNNLIHPPEKILKKSDDAERFSMTSIDNVKLEYNQVRDILPEIK
jgi:hypothetical protein